MAVSLCEPPEDLADLPISAKLVWRDIRADEPMSTTELAHSTQLHRRTVERALATLREQDLVQRFPVSDGSYRYETHS